MRIGDGNDDIRVYKVLVNGEEQYSIWPVDKANPAGWNDAGKSGTKRECLDYIAQVWADMRPRSLRDSMEIGLGIPDRDPEAGPERGGCPMGR